MMALGAVKELDRWNDPAHLARLAAERGPDLMVVVDPSGAVRFASEASTRVMGRAASDEVGRPVWDHVHLDDLVAATGALNEASRSEGYHHPAVFRLRHGDGHWVECEVNATTLEGPGGSWLLLAIRSTGDRDEVMGRRRRIETLIRQASLDCSAVRWAEVDGLVSGYLHDLAQIVGAELIELAWQEGDDPLVVGARWPVLERSRTSGATIEPFQSLWPSPASSGELLHFTSDLSSLPPGQIKDRFIELGSSAAVEVPLSSGVPSAVLRLVFGSQWLSWDDVNTDLVVVLASTLMATLRRCRAEAHLHEQARTDPLTGLMNRSELYRNLESMIASSGGQRRGLDLGVLYCDLDRFKEVNDRFGHAAGDELLVEVADALRGCVREVDLVARFGGDEFVLVCPDLASPETLSQLMARLCHAVDLLAPGDVPMRLSVGAALSRPGLGADELVCLADEAMYRVKRRGRRRPTRS